MELLEPKEIEINGGVYKIGKFPAIAGREILSKYPLSNIPKLGDYPASEEVMLKLMSFVERITPEGQTIRLTSRALIDNHVKDWETLVKIEIASLEHNCSFFQNGKALSFLKKSLGLAEAKITEILTALLAQSLQAAKQPSENLEKSTH